MKPAPSGSSAKSKKPYYLTDAMQFALPYVKVLNSATSGNLPRQAKEEIPDDQEEENWDDDSQTAQPLPSPESVSLPASSQKSDSLPVPPPQSYPSEIPLPLSPVHQNYVSSKRNDRNKKSKDGPDENFDEYFKLKRKKLEAGMNPMQEANKMFLLSLLPDMNMMSSHQTRKFKRKVIDLMDNILHNSSNILSPNSSIPTDRQALTEVESAYLPTQDVNTPSLHSTQHPNKVYYEIVGNIINTNNTNV
uniref:Uncharacterized protein LOC114345854 n=1 Tax=Diabrotica virgifera virgifera TaxID=50390 RepID=A0A6P7H439_DIAVI